LENETRRILESKLANESTKTRLPKRPAGNRKAQRLRLRRARLRNQKMRNLLPLNRNAKCLKEVRLSSSFANGHDELLEKETKEQVETLMETCISPKSLTNPVGNTNQLGWLARIRTNG